MKRHRRGEVKRVATVAGQVDVISLFTLAPSGQYASPDALPPSLFYTADEALEAAQALIADDPHPTPGYDPIVA